MIRDYNVGESYEHDIERCHKTRRVWVHVMLYIISDMAYRNDIMIMIRVVDDVLEIQMQRYA